MVQGADGFAMVEAPKGAEPATEPATEPAVEPAPSEGEPDAPPVDWIYDVVVSRKGTLRLPVQIEVQFTGGDIESFEWTREAQEGTNWWRLPIEPGPNKIKRVLVDPARRYYLDVNMADNQWYSGKDLVAPLRWSERAFTQYAHLLHWYSSLGG